MAGSRKLGRATDHRKAMLRGMVTYLLENGQIETTETRAKEVRSMAEKMITIAKGITGSDTAADLHLKRQVFAGRQAIPKAGAVQEEGQMVFMADGRKGG